MSEPWDTRFWLLLEHPREPGVLLKGGEIPLVRLQDPVWIADLGRWSREAEALLGFPPVVLRCLHVAWDREARWVRAVFVLESPPEPSGEWAGLERVTIPDLPEAV